MKKLIKDDFFSISICFFFPRSTAVKIIFQFFFGFFCLILPEKERFYFFHCLLQTLMFFCSCHSLPVAWQCLTANRYFSVTSFLNRDCNFSPWILYHRDIKTDTKSEFFTFHLVPMKPEGLKLWICVFDKPANCSVSSCKGLSLNAILFSFNCCNDSLFPHRQMYGIIMRKK